MTVDQRNYIDNAPTAHLTGPIGTSDTTFGIDSLIGFPNYPFIITIDMGTASAEQILVLHTTGSTVDDCIRNYNGQGAESHPNLAAVNHTTVSKDFQEANDHHRATSNVHGVSGALVDTGSAQTLADKTLTGAKVSAVTDGGAGLGTGGVVSAAAAAGNAVFTGKNESGTTKFQVLSDGTTTAGAVGATSATVSGNATVGGTLGVTGTTTLHDVNAANVSATDVSTATLETSGNATVNGAATVVGTTHLEGAVTADANLSVGGTSSLHALSATTVHATGAVTADAGATITGAVGITGDTTVTGNETITGTLSLGGHADVLANYLTPVVDASAGTAAGGMANNGTIVTTILGGKFVHLDLILNMNSNISPTSGNVADFKVFTLNNSAWFPPNPIPMHWSNGVTEGDVIVNTDGTIMFRTCEQAVDGSGGLVLRASGSWFVN